MIKEHLRRLKMDFPEVQRVFSNEYVILLLIFIVGAFFRFKGLNTQSLWYDELVTIFRTAPELSFSKVIANYQVDPHPPLFFLTLHYWLTIFGNNEVTARFLMAIFGSVSVISVYWLGKECLDKKTGFIASLFTAVNFYNLQFSQEVRPYIVLFLFTAFSYTWFIRLIREQTRRNVILYGVFTALMIYSHYYGLIHLLSQVIFLLFYIVFEKPVSLRSLLKHFAQSGIVITLLYSPWIPTTLKMLQRTKHWNPMPKPDFFIPLFRLFFGSEPYLVMLFSGLLLVLLVYFIMPRKEAVPMTGNGLSEEENAYLRLNLSIPVLFSWVFFTLFIPYFRSLVTVPMYYPKYAIGTLPAIMVMAVISIVMLKNRTFRALLVASILLVSLTNIFLNMKYYTLQRKQDWRGVTQYIIRNSTVKYPGKEIYILTENPELYRFYLDSLTPTIKISGFLPLNPAACRKSIIKLLMENRNIGVWLLPGHRPKLYKKIVPDLKQHLTQLERRQTNMGEAILFGPKNRVKE
jgi:uncharacterized membrane protein